MRKVFEEPLTRSLADIQKNIGKRLSYLNKKHFEIISKYRIIFSWNKKNNILCIESTSFFVKAKLKFTQKKVVGYLEIPILLVPILGRYMDDFIKEILKEIESL